MSDVLRKIKQTERKAAKQLADAQEEAAKIVSEARKKSGEIISSAADESVANTQSTLTRLEKKPARKQKRYKKMVQRR